jgi:hypothetical protein
MKLRDYIETATEKAGNQKELAFYLGLPAQNLTNAKAHNRGLPNDDCIKIAQLLNIEPVEVIAASELATEKKPEKRAFWMNFTGHAKAASIALATVITIAGFASNDAKEMLVGVTGFEPATPASRRQESLRQWFRRTAAAVRHLFLGLAQGARIALFA